ncbi:TonB-dependent siderophore receptor [Luteitalea sp.]|uniref:TonB-dependent receptor plug domain-containing protein n=1 Tax=Luteitalea sp. TaxID=2004800 RepID=UPI0025BF69D1|nr:TonB-dependent receptor [Luteitalea sp.]
MSLEDIMGLEAQSVFGASKFLQKVSEAPAAVSIVTADDIARYGWRTLADVLRSVRGFYVTDDRSWAYAGARGFLRPGDYTTRILLTLNGHRVNDNLYDQASVQEDFPIDLLDVDRIEIIRGPASSLYGSNAFFAVINVMTKAASERESIAASLDVGTIGMRTGRVSAGRRLQNGLALGLSATFQQLDGVQDLYFPEYDDAATNFGVASGNDFTARRNVFANLTYGSLAVQSGFNRRTRGMPTGAYGATFNDARARVHDTQLFVDANYERPVGNGWTGLFRGGYHYYAYLGEYPFQDGDVDPRAPSAMYLDEGVGDYVMGEMQFSRRIGRRHRVTGGVEHRANLRQNQVAYYEAAAPEFELNTRSSTTALYAQDEFRLHRTLLLNLGLRYDQYSTFPNPLKPRFAAIYQANDRTTLKFLFGQAFRAPNTYELHYEADLYKAGVDLRPEEVQTTEAVVEQYLGKRIRLSGSVFVYDVKELLDLRVDPADGLFWYQNSNAARATGVEAEVEGKWPRGVQGRLSYAFTRARDASPAGQTLTNSPAHVTQALFSAPLGAGAVVGIETRALSSRLLRSGGVVDGHVIANATVSGPLSKLRARWSLTVENLAGHRYADPVGADLLQEAIVQNGRTARLRILWSR